MKRRQRAAVFAAHRRDNHETLGNAPMSANFPRSMTRLVLSLFVAAFAASFNACEKHTIAELPEHYTEKVSGEPKGGAHESIEAHGEKAAEHGEHGAGKKEQ